MTDALERAESRQNSKNRRRRADAIPEALVLMHPLPAVQVRPHPERMRIDVIEADGRSELEPVGVAERQRKSRIPVQLRAELPLEDTRLPLGRVGVEINVALLG